MDGQENLDSGKQSQSQPDLEVVNLELESANQQLVAIQQQLRAANQQLAAGNQQLRAAEEQVRTSRARYKAVFEGTINAINVYEPTDDGNDFILKNLNPAARRIEKVKRKDVIDKSILKIFPHSAETGLIDVVRKVFRTGSPQHHSDAFYLDGRITQWRQFYIFKLSTGQIVTIYEDVTGRKIAEETLAEEHKLLRTLIDNLPDSIYVKDTNGRFVIANNEIARRTGLKTPQRLIGKTDRDIHPEELADKYHADEQQVIKTGQPLHHREEHVIDKSTDEVIWNLTTKIPLRDSHERIVGIIGIGRNITRLKQIEQQLNAANQQLLANEQQLRAANQQLEAANQQLNAANQQLMASEQQLRASNQQLEATNQQLKATEEVLQQSEKRYRTLVEKSFDGIFVQKGAKITFANPQLHKMLGYNEGELVGMDHELVYHTDYRQLTIKRAQMRMQGKSVPSRYEVKLQRKDKSCFFGEIDAQAVTLDDTKGIQVWIRDITERKLAEQKLVDYQAQLKSLASQLSLAEERERRRIATELHDRIGQALVISKVKLEQLRKSASSENLINELDEVSKSISQTIEDTRLLTFDLSYPILYELGFEAAVAEWLEEQIQQKHGIETEFIDDGKSKPLDDDLRVLLFREVKELLVNVVKHAKAKNVKVVVQKIDSEIQISVEDDGVGFKAGEIASIATETGGFGLFSIRERLEPLGGCLKIDSVPGHGCCVIITAPLKQFSD